MKVLVACEKSQRVCIAFRERGHEAYSCDILEPSGGHPEWHIKGNCLTIIGGGTEFVTCDKQKHVIDDLWDLVIAHPPCTYLTVTGNRWFSEDNYFASGRARYLDRIEAIKFFMQFVMCRAKRVAIENPVGIMSGVYRKPDQIIEPYMFGDPYEKKTCLWLRNLPRLEETDRVEPEPRQYFDSGKSMPYWYSHCKGDRANERSKTFPGIAKAMAEQWGG